MPPKMSHRFGRPATIPYPPTNTTLSTMTTSTSTGLTCQPARVAVIRVSECPITNTVISFAARRHSPASSTTPPMNRTWSQPSSMCSMPSGTNPSTLRSPASSVMPCAHAGAGATATSAPASRRPKRVTARRDMTL